MIITLLNNQIRHNNNEILFLLRQVCFLTFLLGTTMLSGYGEAAAQETIRVAFWNVENLFDTYDDTCRNDDAFTPKGENRWTEKRYRKKLNNIAQTVVAMGDNGTAALAPPVLMGLAEVENDKVLRDLCEGTSLRRFNYKSVHYDSPDRRGIDNALLYRKDYFNIINTQAVTVSDSVEGFFTRDILMVTGTVPQGDTIVIIVNHFPSKRGGAEADRNRMNVAKRLREVMDSTAAKHPCSAIIVVGDFNASPSEAVIRKTLMGNGDDYINLMSNNPVGEGSYKYQGNWDFIDQIIVCKSMMENSSGEHEECSKLRVKGNSAHAFAPDFLLVDDSKNMGKKVNRTYLAMKYQGGFSDHLPVYIDIRF